MCREAVYVPDMRLRLLLLARHGQSVFNVDGVVNGDPGRDLGLSARGQDDARRLGGQVAGIQIELRVTSCFPRAQQTAQLALGERTRDVPHEIDAELDDIRVGELEGRTLADYRTWKHGHSLDEPFPCGESLHDAARRYAAAYERLLARDAETILCVCHEIPVRYIANAAAGSDQLDAPTHDVANATPYLFDADTLRRAIGQLRAIAGPSSKR